MADFSGNNYGCERFLVLRKRTVLRKCTGKDFRSWLGRLKMPLAPMRSMTLGQTQKVLLLIKQNDGFHRRRNKRGTSF